ncbi:MAG: polyprenyl synthetase family protein [Armatimonadetes bacterium]|nr:polyprenyl synthetase family protein [Armatimonadota bacterium]
MRAQPVAAVPAGSSWLDPIRDDLDAIEALLSDAVASQVKQVYSISEHVLLAGGKRLRPALVALATRCLAPDASTEAMARVAAAVELVHMATLVHDDVVDSSAVRRGKATANAVFGNGMAVIVGDYLLARSMHLLSDGFDRRILRAVSAVTIEMSEGEVMEILATGDTQLTEDAHLEIIRKKTAVFLEGCCRCGAILADAGEAEEDALARYGSHMGIAFQLADDLLDYLGDPAVTGKPVGSDLREGRATLPFILALENAPPDVRERLLAAFGNPGLTDADVTALVRLMERLQVFGRARTAARMHADRAVDAVSQLPPSPYRASLAELAEYCVARER